MNIRIETDEIVGFSLWFDKDKQEHDLDIHNGETNISIEGLRRAELEDLRDIIDLYFTRQDTKKGLKLD